MAMGLKEAQCLSGAPLAAFGILLPDLRQRLDHLPEGHDHGRPLQGLQDLLGARVQVRAGHAERGQGYAGPWTTAQMRKKR